MNNEIYSWVNEKGLSELESTLRVISVYAYTWCLFNSPINFNNEIK